MVSLSTSMACVLLSDIITFSIAEASFVSVPAEANELSGHLRTHASSACSTSLSDSCTPDKALHILEVTKGFAEMPSKTSIPSVDPGCGEEHDSKQKR